MCTLLPFNRCMLHVRTGKQRMPNCCSTSVKMRRTNSTSVNRVQVKKGGGMCTRVCRNVGLSYDEKQIRNKFTDMKKKFLNWQILQNKTGLGRDPTTGAVVAEDLAPNHTKVGSHKAVMPLPFPLSLCTNPNMWSYLCFRTNPNIWLPLCRSRVQMQESLETPPCPLQ